MPVAIWVTWLGLSRCFLMFAVYSLVPNTEVEPAPTAVGAIVAVVLFEIGKQTLGLALNNAFSFSHLFGSLGLIPLFMFWVYLMWLTVLFGLQVSTALQMLHGRRLEELERTREIHGLIEPASLIVIMQEIATQFEAGHSTTTAQIAEVVSIPRATVREILERFIQADLLHRVNRESDAVTLAFPADHINVGQLIEIGFRMIDEGARQRSAFFDRLRDAQRELAGTRTLAGLLSPAAKPG